MQFSEEFKFNLILLCVSYLIGVLHDFCLQIRTASSRHVVFICVCVCVCETSETLRF